MYGNEQSWSGNARPGRRGTTAVAWPGCFAFLLAGLLGSLPAQEAPSGKAPPEKVSPADRALSARVVASAEALVRDEEPLLRGEAALVLAGEGELRHYDEILAVARDRDLQARVRGTVALGILAVPGVEAFLGEVLDDSLTRPTPPGIAAALALGLLPEDHPQPHVTDYLMRFRSSSLRRQRDVMAAMLAGLAGEPHPNTTAALIELLEDDANKDGELRAQMLGVLLQVEDGLTAELREELLEDGRPEERARLLRHMAAVRTELEDKEVRRLQRAVVRDRSPDVRAAALRYLTAIRHLPALELGARAMKSHHPVEAAQGVRTTLLLGGGVMRKAVEEHIQETVKPVLVTAMLEAFEPPFSEEFVDFLARIVGDRSRPLTLRTTAGLALARAGEVSVAPALRTLFLENDDPVVLRELARAVLTLDEDPPPLERLGPTFSLEDAELLPRRLSSLMTAGHPDVLPRMVDMLEDPAVAPATKADIFHAYRLATGASVPAERAGDLPALLRPLFR